VIGDLVADTDQFDMPVVRETPAAVARTVAPAEEAEGRSIRRWIVGLSAVAIVLRVGYLLLGTPDPRLVAWYMDSFHHWQISYLSKEIGFFNGPRLWDLGGLEYFWGFIPAVLGALAMAVTFTSDIWPMQFLNLAAGTVTVGLLYRVGRRYWSHSGGVILALFFAVAPVSVLTDVSAMQEPVALLFLVLSLYVFLERPMLAGFLLGLAAASRPDYWVYSMAILGSAAIALRALRSRPPFLDLGRIRPYLGGYALVLVPYVLFLWMQTGNPVYPLYWNFIGNARGEWLGPVELTETMRSAQTAARGLLVVAVVGHVVVLWRRPAGWPLLIAGLWGLTLIGFMLGISQYIRNYLDRFWLDRIMLLMYLFAAAVLALSMVRLEQRLGLRRFPLAIVLAAPVILSLNLLWAPAMQAQARQAYFRDHLTFGAEVAALAREGDIVIPGDQPLILYSLSQHGVRADRLLSALYHPEYSPAARDEFFAWLRRFDVRWMLVKPDETFYHGVIASEPEHFELAHGGPLQLYRVKP